MRIQLNLASRPFVELGPLYLRLRILIALLALIATPLWFLLATEKRKAAEAHARLAAVAGLSGANAGAKKRRGLIAIAVS
jgi:type IV pilus assembly protein PilN